MRLAMKRVLYLAKTPIFIRQGATDGPYRRILTHLSPLLIERGVSIACFSGRQTQFKASLADVLHESQFFSRYRQPKNHSPRMADNPSGHLDHPPAERGDGVPSPAFRTGQALEPDKQVIGDDPDPEINRIGP